jgi:hypothetical protein
LAITFKQEFKRTQEEGRVPYITDIELDGMVINARESIVDVLESRFGTVSPRVSERLETIDDISVLKQLIRQSAVIDSVEEFQLRLNEIPPSEEVLE